jgi:hypothetical protein
LEAKDCPAEQIKYFREWDGWSLLCPDIPDGAGFEVYCDTGCTEISSFVLSARKCNNNTLRLYAPYWEPVCAPMEEIDQYVRNVSVETWLIGSKIDFSKRGRRPTFSSQNLGL